MHSASASPSAPLANTAIVPASGDRARGAARSRLLRRLKTALWTRVHASGSRPSADVKSKQSDARRGRGTLGAPRTISNQRRASQPRSLKNSVGTDTNMNMGKVHGVSNSNAYVDRGAVIDSESQESDSRLPADLDMSPFEPSEKRRLPRAQSPVPKRRKRSAVSPREKSAPVPGHTIKSAHSTRSESSRARRSCEEQGVKRPSEKQASRKRARPASRSPSADAAVTSPVDLQTTSTASKNSPTIAANIQTTTMRTDGENSDDYVANERHSHKKARTDKKQSARAFRKSTTTLKSTGSLLSRRRSGGALVSHNRSANRAVPRLRPRISSKRDLAEVSKSVRQSKTRAYCAHSKSRTPMKMSILDKASSKTLPDQSGVSVLKQASGKFSKRMLGTSPKSMSIAAPKKSTQTVRPNPTLEFKKKHPIPTLLPGTQSDKRKSSKLPMNGRLASSGKYKN